MEEQRGEAIMGQTWVLERPQLFLHFHWLIPSHTAQLATKEAGECNLLYAKEEKKRLDFGESSSSL